MKVLLNGKSFIYKQTHGGSISELFLKKGMLFISGCVAAKQTWRLAR